MSIMPSKGSQFQSSRQFSSSRQFFSRTSNATAIHFCGHMISVDETGRFPKSQQQTRQQAVVDYFQGNQIKCAFGSLAAGADILIAESAIQKGVAVHAIFPYAIDDFINNSVLPSGEDWLSRFNSVLKQAQSITIVYLQNPQDEISSYAHCTEVAMGLCLLELVKTDTAQTAEQLTLWDGKATNGIAGSYPDMLRWNALGLESFYFDTKSDILNSQPNQNNQSSSALPLTKFELSNNQQSISKVPSFVAYKRQVEHLRTKHPKYFFAINDKLNLEETTCWDLDHQLFGRHDEFQDSLITNRCAGMLAFHLIREEQDSTDPNFLISSLKQLNKLRTGGRSKQNE